MPLNFPVSCLMFFAISHTIQHTDSEIDAYSDPKLYCRNKGNDRQICDVREGKVCQNSTCQSVCHRRGYRPCQCPKEDDRYCYLCCGNEVTGCQPAHQHKIFRPNGEKWEREDCRWCLNKPDGLLCSDKDIKRLCRDGKCVANICLGMPEGVYCDLKKEKICLNDECRNPCGKRLICDCDESVAPGVASEHRCQLCCFDFARKKCLNAKEHFGISKYENRPIVRSELSCHSGKTCNRYGVCGVPEIRPHITLLLLCICTFIFIRRI